MLTQAVPTSESTLDPTWPREVGLILSALEAAKVQQERRSALRMPYRVRAMLRLLVGGSQPDNEKILYVRDVNHRGLGFVAPHLLPLGYGGVVRLVAPDGGLRNIVCTLLRCRRVSPGWYEGMLHFHREQVEFAAPHPSSESAD